MEDVEFVSRIHKICVLALQNSCVVIIKKGGSKIERNTYETISWIGTRSRDHQIDYSGRCSTWHIHRTENTNCCRSVVGEAQEESSSKIGSVAWWIWSA
jgi:hypothetical protein